MPWTRVGSVEGPGGGYVEVERHEVNVGPFLRAPVNYWLQRKRWRARLVRSEGETIVCRPCDSRSGADAAAAALLRWSVAPGDDLPAGYERVDSVKSIWQRMFSTETRPCDPCGRDLMAKTRRCPFCGTR